jgi:hypothetical protein
VIASVNAWVVKLSTRLRGGFQKDTVNFFYCSDNISGLALKSVSYTQWESRVHSVKPIRF